MVTTQPIKQRRSERPDTDWDRIQKMTWSVIGWAIIAVAAIWLAGRLWTVLLPLGIGLVTVFFLRGPVEWMAARKVPRALAVLACYLVAIGLLVAAGFVLLPVAAQQVTAFVDTVPAYFERAQTAVADVSAHYSATLPEWASGAIDDALDDAASQASMLPGYLATWLFATGRGVFGTLTGLLTGLVVGFYLLYTLPHVGPGILDAMPPGWRRDTRAAAQRVEEVVGGFIRGQLIVATLVGTLTWIGMAVIGMPFPGAIGIIAGLFDVVPYLGPIAATIIAAFIGVFTEPILAVWAIVVIVIVQQIETHLISPRVMGEQVGLHPVIVILSIIAGATLFGFFGLLLAIPLVGTLKALYGHFAEKHGWEPW